MSVPCANHLKRNQRSKVATLRRNRAGSLVIIAALLMVFLMGLVALAVDVGYINLARTQAQTAADAASLAAVATLHAPMGTMATEISSIGGAHVTEARQTAVDYVSYHHGGATTSMLVDYNWLNDINGDVVLGVLRWDGNLNEPLDQLNSAYNSVRVTVRFDSGSANGPLGLFFGRVFGYNNTDVSASATAKAEYPSLLPFAVEEEKFKTIYEGGDGDLFTYTPGGPGFGITHGADGFPEVKVFPDSTAGPGNFGIIQIGPPSTDTTQQLQNVMNQVDMGPTIDEFDWHGGSLYHDMLIDGKTGIKSVAKYSFLGGTPPNSSMAYPGMLGEPRYLATYTSSSGNGANAEFKLGKFVAVRVMAIELDGVIFIDPFASVGATNEITGIWVQLITDKNLLNKPHLVR